MWFSSPLIGWWLTRKPSLQVSDQKLRGGELRSLRLIARRTWRYFADFMGPDTSWLPPDNYQVSHKDQLALRTSPTNIGLGMLSTLAACDFGYLTLDQVVARLTNTMSTIKQLERHEGHLLNWYSLEDLQPLNPRYVSSVDSGNFIAALWTLEQGMDEILKQPLLSPLALGGLLDTGEILLEELENKKSSPEIIRAAIELDKLIRDCPSGILDQIRCMRRIHASVKSFVKLMPVGDGTQAGAAYWAGQLENEISAWVDLLTVIWSGWRSWPNDQKQRLGWRV